MRIILQQGIFSRSQFAVLHDLKLIGENRRNPLFINQRDICEVEDGKILLSRAPYSDLYCYKKESGEKLEIESNLSNPKEIKIKNVPEYSEVVADYYFKYSGATTTAVVGRAALQGFLSLQARTKVKDDITGQVKTGILTIPKVKLMSDLSMVLGKTVDPLMGRMVLMAYPAGTKVNRTVMELAFLPEDLDSDL